MAWCVWGWFSVFLPYFQLLADPGYSYHEGISPHTSPPHPHSHPSGRLLLPVIQWEVHNGENGSSRPGLILSLVHMDLRVALFSELLALSAPRQSNSSFHVWVVFSKRAFPSYLWVGTDVSTYHCRILWQSWHPASLLKTGGFCSARPQQQRIWPEPGGKDFPALPRGHLLLFVARCKTDCCAHMVSCYSFRDRGLSVCTSPSAIDQCHATKGGSLGPFPRQIVLTHNGAHPWKRAYVWTCALLLSGTPGILNSHTSHTECLEVCGKF